MDRARSASRNCSFESTTAAKRTGKCVRPLVLGYSVVEALSMAVASVADYRVAPNLDMPVTPERVLMGVERMREAARA